MRPYILAETNWKDLKNREVELAVLPWGATEAHNYHLPYATDNYQIEAITAEAGRLAWEKKAKLVILPNIPFGVNTGQADIKLNINLNPSTQFQILSDIIQVLNRQGIFKLILLNGHGGNDFKPLLRELGLKYPDILLVTTNFYSILDKSQFFQEAGDHADEMETSLMLYLRSDLVMPLEEAGKGEEKKSKIKGIREGWVWSERKWSMVTADTGIGNPKKATEKKGKEFFNAVTAKISELFIDVDKVEINNRYG
ncbi:creatininase family protein [Salinimicrobium sp. HB62]|uniref:creatininase family protein n=1 Tax=Salinimicrobium sp. HB62 TaxID=3077781 RepID=UPI002D79BD83|nr:creatininase family protein [Salinimicrobium sp. HB62]